MVNQDDVDTAPVLARDDARVVFRSVLAEPGAEVELVLEPDEDLQDPLLFVSVNPQDAVVSVERVTCGKRSLVASRSPAEKYKFGFPTRTIVAHDESMAISFVNNDLRQVRIGASLVSGEERPDGAYHLRQVKE